MITCERAAMLNAPAHEVFQAFVDPAARLELMGDYVSRIECSGSGLGAVYAMWLEGEDGPACVKEVTVAYDASRHSMEVEMIDTGGVVPFGNYRARLDVQDAGPGRCIAVLQSSFVPIGIGEEEARSLAESNYDRVFVKLKSRFGAGQNGAMS